MLKVKLVEGPRMLDEQDSGFEIHQGQIKELHEKMFKSYALRAELFSGKLRVVDGEHVLPIKEAVVLFSGKYPGVIYGYEFGKAFRKNLDTREFDYIENPPKYVCEKLNIPYTEERLEEEVIQDGS